MDVREKLVELLYKAEEQADKRCDFAENCDKCHANNQKIDCMDWLKADCLLSLGVTVQEWISVKDRLPKSIANKVIVRCKNDYVGFGHYEDYKGKQTWYNLESDKPFTDWNYDDDCDSYEVTHWMPLPQPPKGE